MSNEQLKKIANPAPLGLLGFGLTTVLLNLANAGCFSVDTMILAMGKGKYALITAIPGLFMIPVTFSAGYLNIVTNYLPKGLYLLVFLTAILMFLTAIIFIEAFKKWYELIQTHGKPLNGSGRVPINVELGGACEQPKI